MTDEQRSRRGVVHAPVEVAFPPLPLLFEVPTMCRLAAWYGPPAPAASLVLDGDHPLYEQSWAPRTLLHGTVNADGWGVAGFDDAGGWRLARAEPIWYDPDLRGQLDRLGGRSILAALRNATPGLPVDRSGLLPFLREGWAFALNGFVPGFRERHMRELQAAITPERHAELVGTSDGETLFALTLDGITAGESPIGAMTAVRDRVRARLSDDERAPLTMVLASAEGIWAVNTAADRPGPGETNTLFVADGLGPMAAGATLASEPLTAEDGWRPVPPHHSVAIAPSGIELAPIG